MGPVKASSSAVTLIDEGNVLEEQGRVVEAMARYDAAVQMDPLCARAHLNRGNILFAGARIDEARSAYELAASCDPNYAAAHFNLGNLNCHLGGYEFALRNYQVAVAAKPDFANAYVAMGNVLGSLGRSAEAKESYHRALEINPTDAGVHFNLGLLAAGEGLFEPAACSLRMAIDLRPDYAEAHRVLLSILPDSDEILSDLVSVLLGPDKSIRAVPLTWRHVEHAPPWIIKTAFADRITRAHFNGNDLRLRAALAEAITEPWAAPFQLCRAAVRLIMRDPTIARCVQLVNEAWPKRPPVGAFGLDTLNTFASDSLLLAVLESAPVSALRFERLLTVARQALLETALNEQDSKDPGIAALGFYASLTRQCFINEYIFDCDEGLERTAALRCRTKLLALLDADAAIPPLLVLAVGAYFPLYTLSKPERLLRKDHPGPLMGVLRQQICEPLEERTLRMEVQNLTSITEGVSELVRDQYEQNPYPRWVKLPTHEPQLPFNEDLQGRFPHARFTPLLDDRQPEVLIAGCGTGSQPVLFTSRFRGVRVLAVDLSLSSLSYAMRKTRELGIENVEYAQADILKLGDTRRTFDIIASEGVLHHLADPFVGWRTLLSLLRPGGFMQLGLYSNLGRRNVVKARNFIASRGYRSTPEEIRRFRRDLIALGTEEVQWLSNCSDFYSTSECRDAVFHRQEHRLNLDQIASFLSDCGLDFIGFELEGRVLHQYHARFADDPGATNLRNWAKFEMDHPDTFASMYDFWIQKPMSP
jgi:tetratricopeptide (TPR) repeat protein/SAM-dependent methyltransferase